jgi:hypothetical protein
MQTQCIYDSCVFSKIGKGTRYHIFPDDDLSYAYCGSGPANGEDSNEMVRLGSICLNCHREFIKEMIEKEREKNAESTEEL